MASITELKRTQTAMAVEGSALLNPLLQGPHISRFDPDAWHVMQERDNALIRDELLHGSASDAFVYAFSIGGKPVSGVSVVGARELASQYKGIKSRIVATVEKRGSLFIFRTFTPLSIDTRVISELSDEEDFYECVMEVSDIKTGNSIEVRKKETKLERRSNGSTFERPHYDVIAESKAFRNGVLSVLPQSVIRDFKERCLKAGKGVSQEKTIQQLREGALGYAAKNALALDRNRLNDLTYNEVMGLGGAAAQGLEHFHRAAIALGLVAGVDVQRGEIPPPPAPPVGAVTQPAPAPAAAAPTPAADPAHQPAATPLAADTGPTWGDDTAGAPVAPPPPAQATQQQPRGRGRSGPATSAE